MNDDDCFEMDRGNIRISIVKGTSIHLKCADPHGDPVELSSAEAIELAELLIRLAKETG